MKIEELQIKINIMNEEETMSKLTVIKQNIDEITQAAKGLNDVLDEINGIHGYWKVNKKLYMPECSVCEARPFKGYIPSMDEVKKTYKYCPNCGAKMGESEDKE